MKPKSKIQNLKSKTKALLVGTIAIAALANIAWWHPYSIDAFNQVFGGTRAGVRTFTLGWGEGLEQVADWLKENLSPRGVGVVMEAEHLCMSLRGVRAAGSRTITSALHGVLREDVRSRHEFFALCRSGG